MGTRPLAAAALAVLSLSCQAYDFEPVYPVAFGSRITTVDIPARQLKPNVMLVVDKSGSMNRPADATDPDCQVAGRLCGGSAGERCDEALCPTRWSELQIAMQQFLGGSTVARFGLTVFPEVDGGDSCTAPSAVRQDIPQTDDTGALAAAADAANGTLQAIESFGPTAALSTGGGTPAGPALRFVGELPSLRDPVRRDFVLLLTDGAPNCNPDWNGGTYSPGCVCTTTPSTTCATADTDGKYPLYLCLDDDGAANEVRRLAGLGIQTIVVGFGADTGSGGYTEATLNRLADEGGFARSCGSAGCTPRYYQAATGAELADALARIAGGLAIQCTYELVLPPTERGYLAVLWNGEEIPSGPDSWELDPGGAAVNFLGSRCEQLKAQAGDVSLQFFVTRLL